MPRDSINDLRMFLAVAQARSFTRAAARLGMSQSALSHAVRGLEAKLGVRLLTRTTRSVAPTEAGERLLQNVAPRFAEIESELAAVSDLGEKPSGTVRITSIDHVVDSVLWPRLAPLVKKHPGLNIEINVDYRLVDVVAEGFDIGVRYGDQVAKDMVAVRLTDERKMYIVGSPEYFRSHPEPTSPQDLLRHNCVVLRLAGGGGLYAWELKHGQHALPARVSGQTVFNGAYQMLHAALTGCGLALLPEDLALPHLEAGRLVSVLRDWSPTFEALHAYYPNRRNHSRALKLVIDALRAGRDGIDAGAAD